MNSPQVHLSRHYTVADYASWNDNQRYELLHGQVRIMAPAPTLHHHAISRNLSFEVGHFLKSNAKCQIFYAPVDVYLSDDTVVQPDIIVVCDPQKLKPKGCIGAPDLIVEILSPSTAKTDWKEKYQLYEQVGVREYWIVNPDDRLLHVFRLQNSTFQLAGTYTAEDSVSIGIFDNVVIDLKNVFAE